MRFSARLSIAFISTLAFAAGASAAYPEQPIKLVVPLTAGGVTDFVARSSGAHLGQQFKQSVIVDNKPGAGGMIAGDYVAKSKPDGYTLLLASIGQSVANPYLYKKVPYDTKRDLVPVGLIAVGQNVLVVNYDSPFKTARDVIEAAKKSPGTLTYGSFGNGSSSHLAGAMFTSMAGVSAVHVPYKGSAPAMMDLIGGNLSYMFDSLNTSLPQIAAKKVRALALTGDKRSALLPNVPTLDEVGLKGYNLITWFGVHAPKGTPPQVMETLSKGLLTLTSDPAIQKQFTEQGLEIQTNGTPAEYARFLEAQDKKVGELIKANHISSD